MAMSTMQAASAKSAAKLEAPHGTCDTHMHFYDKKYPLAPTAASAPPEDGSVATYRALQRRIGITRTVVVQPTAYGKDNTCTLDGMAALGKDTARGVAVVDDRVSEAELRRLDDLGMRAARLHMLPGGAIPWEIADAVVKRVQSVGWHAQLQLNGRLLPDRERQILGWPGRVVIDHIGRIADPVAVENPAFLCLLRLLDTGRVWVKLSAPYLVSKSGPPRYEDVSALAKTLAKAAPERMLWATNWPHPNEKHPPDEAGLLDLLLDWAPDEATRRKILVDNPAALYGF
jgi:D-galactarolactone isomerase